MMWGELLKLFWKPLVAVGAAIAVWLWYTHQIHSADLRGYNRRAVEDQKVVAEWQIAYQKAQAVHAQQVQEIVHENEAQQKLAADRAGALARSVRDYQARFGACALSQAEPSPRGVPGTPAQPQVDERVSEAIGRVTAAQQQFFADCAADAVELAGAISERDSLTH